VRATRLHHKIGAAELRGRLFLCAPIGLKFAEQQNGSRLIVPGDLEHQLRTIIAQRDIDLVIIDPLVKSHTADENDYAAIDQVAILLTTLAADAKCAVDCLHHERKGPLGAGDADRARGASSFRDAARLLYTLTPMTRDEAEQFGLAEVERKSFVRLDGAKLNIAPPADAQWFHIVGVPLGNETAEYPHGDIVPTVEAWDPPDLWHEMTTAVVNAILDQIERGPSEGRRYSASKQAGAERAAWRAVQKHRPDFTEKQCRMVIDTWLRSGMIVSRDYHDARSRRDQPGLSVIKRPG
jgi:hypothetical protein